MKNFDKSETLSEILHDQITLFCKFGIQQRMATDPMISSPYLREHMEKARDKVNWFILNIQPISAYFPTDYPELHLMNENPDAPQLIECLAYYLDANILVLHATEDGGKYAIVEHYSPTSVINKSIHRTTHFLVRLYGQYWGSVKPRFFYDHEDPGGHLADAVINRIQRVVDCYLNIATDDGNVTIETETSDADGSTVPVDVNAVISFRTIFEPVESNTKTENKAQTAPKAAAIDEHIDTQFELGIEDSDEDNVADGSKSGTGSNSDAAAASVADGSKSGTGSNSDAAAPSVADGSKSVTTRTSAAAAVSVADGSKSVTTRTSAAAADITKDDSLDNRKHPLNDNCIFYQASSCEAYHKQHNTTPYNNPLAVYMYESTVNISYMYLIDDHFNFPEFSFFVSLTSGIKRVVRYLHVRRREALRPNQDEFVNIFDEVTIASISKQNTTFFFLGSVTHELYQGSVVNYFLVRSVVDLKPEPGQLVEYKVKNYAISKVGMTCS